jgi:uncharacterized membrane protein YjjB (DUF3815 family)
VIFASVLVPILWSGLFAACIAIVLTSPPKYLANSFLAGASGRFVQEALIMSGLAPAAATLFAAAAVVLVAVAAQRNREVSPAIVISAVLPLASIVSMVNAMWHLLTLASLRGEALKTAIAVLGFDVAEVGLTSLAIAAGVGLGLAIVRVGNMEQLWGEA